MELDSIDIVVVGIIGISAILPLISALKANKTIALANKESIVVAGNLIKKYAIESKGSIIPVDSEHSAIFQSLVGEAGNRLKKITLTASGGPFLEKDFGDFVNITSDEAIRHPNWDMGKKVSVDSATLMNKGLEAIEAHWLFDIEIENIEIIIHPQSVIHSMVHFVDGTVKTLMSIPDMRIPIQYALSYPNRIESTTREFNITEISKLEFRKPDQKKFRNLALAFEAMKSGGNMPCILNAANDAAVGAFLSNHIGFLDIHDIIEETMNSVHYITEPSLEEYFETDRIARIKAYELINKIN